jgi:F0F1-type ATP synthase assembly protein I
MNAEKPKYQKAIEGLDQLSLGISMVVAVAMGVGIGIGLKTLFEIDWLLWLGVFWGVAAAFLNVYKAYKKLQKEMDEVAKNPKYDQKYQNHGADDDDD